MNEKTNKDYYLPVIISQVIICSLLTFLVFSMSKSDGGLKEDFFTLISQNLDGMEISSAVETVRDYLSSNDVFAFLKQNSDSSDGTEVLSGTGGEDLEFYEAAKNTSFAPVFSTTEICPPVEDGIYTSYFGYRINPITGEYGFHTGLDIAAAEGTNIRASFNGTVTKIGEDAQAGKYIYLTHDDGFVTFYCHCSVILAEEGAVIRRGETIALVGSTGYSTGPHLHFEIRRDGIRYNPLWLLEK